MSQQFILSSFTPEDVQDLFELLQDETIHANTLIIPHPYTLSDAAGYINFCLERYNSWQAEGKSGHPLQQCIRDPFGKLIGNISIGYIPATQGYPAKGDIGYYLHKDYRGRGMMPRVVAAMLSNAFSDVWDIDRVEAAHFSFNPASGRVMQKAGMTFEGTLRGMYKKDGKLIDGEMYSVLRRESQ